MHAYLIVGRDKENIDQKIKELLEKEDLTKLEFTVQKIDDVRELEKFVKLSLDKPTAILIRDVDTATQETLNAFLKNLEEPQKKLKYILTASNIYSILPTIVSRCQVINIQPKNIENTEAGEKFIKSNLSEKISLIDQIRKRDYAVSLIKEVILYSHKEMLKNKDKELYFAKVIKLAQNTLDNLNANGNVNLQLSVFALKLSDLS